MFFALFGREVCDVVSLGSRRAPVLDLELLEVLLWAGKKQRRKWTTIIGAKIEETLRC